MLEKHHLPARIQRLRDLASRFGKELTIWKTAEHPLTPVELEAYREALHDAIRGLVNGAGVLEKVLARMSKGNRPGNRMA